MKRSLLVLLLLTVSAALILLTLDRLMGSPSRKPNGFNRKFEDRRFEKLMEFKLNKSHYKIAGLNGNKIYLQTKKAGDLFALDISTNNIEAIKLDIPDMDNLEPAFMTTVKYPYVYITGTNARKLIRGNLNISKIEVFNIPTGPVLSLEMIDNENSIVRCIDTVEYSIEFRKFNFARGTLGSPVKAGKTEGENLFSLDGQLSFDGKNKKLWYVNYYRNNIISFDTNLENITWTKTIDTMHSAKVSVKHMEASFTHSAPPQNVNKQNFVHGGRLYVHSALAADNELLSEDISTIIDLYAPEYKNSFYIPVPSKEFQQAFMLDNSRLAVLLRDRLIIFAIR